MWRARKAVDGHTREDQSHRSGAATGEPVQQEGCRRSSGDAAERERKRQRAGQAEIEHRDGAECRRAGHTDDARLGERITQQPLHGGAADAETEADETAEQRPRQPQLGEHQRGERFFALENILERLHQIERCVADRKRCPHQDDNEDRDRSPRSEYAEELVALMPDAILASGSPSVDELVRGVCCPVNE